MLETSASLSGMKEAIERQDHHDGKILDNTNGDRHSPN